MTTFAKCEMPKRTSSSTEGGAVALAIDFGGTKVDAALVASDGTIVAESRHALPTGRALSRDQIERNIQTVAGEAIRHVGTRHLLGVGVGTAGPIDATSGTTSPINLPLAARLRFTDSLRPVVGHAPITVTLDGISISLAEYWVGASVGATNALAMVVSTGVGGGFVINGRPVTGHSGNAGHIGQLRIRESHREDPHEGTVESIASGPRTVRWAQSKGWLGNTGEELAVAYRSGDPVAVAAVTRSAHAVGEAIANASTLLDLDVAVVGGGFVNVAADYLDLVRTAVHESAVVEYARRVRIEAPATAGDGPLIGAAAPILATGLFDFSGSRAHE